MYLISDSIMIISDSWQRPVFQLLVMFQTTTFLTRSSIRKNPTSWEKKNLSHLGAESELCSNTYCSTNMC